MGHTKAIFLLITFLSFVFISCNINDSNERTLITVNSAQIYLINTVTDTLYSVTRGEQPFFISNSNKILYRSSDSLFTINNDGTDKRFLSKAYGGSIFLNMGITLSDDGRYVLYSGGEKAPNDLYLVSISSGSMVNLTNSPDREEDNPHFYMLNNRIIYSELIYKDKVGGDFYRNGISSIDISGNSYEKISPDSVDYLYIGSTMDEKYFVVEDYYANKDSSATIITLLNGNDNSIKDTIKFINQPRLSIITVDNKGYLYYNLNDNGIFKINLFTKEKTEIYTGYVDGDCSISSDFEKVLFLRGANLIMLDIQTGQMKTYFNNMGANYALWYFKFSEDGKYIIVEKARSEQVYNY